MDVSLWDMNDCNKFYNNFDLLMVMFCRCNECKAQVDKTYVNNILERAGSDINAMEKNKENCMKWVKLEKYVDGIGVVLLIFLFKSTIDHYFMPVLKL